MKIKAFFLLGLMFIHYSIYAQKPDLFNKIKSIEILKSTREDIIKIFGQPDDSTFPYYKSYELKDGEMNVEYSAGLCGDKTKEGWNAPEFTVIRIFFMPNKPISPQKLAIDLKGFSKHEIYDVPGAFEFENEEIGINYSLKPSGKVENVEFYPPKKYDNLYCKE